MAYQCTKYRLTAEGTIPDFLYLGEDGVGGVFVVADPSTASPRDNMMIGIVQGRCNRRLRGHPDLRLDLQSYLAQVGANWTQPDPADPTTPCRLTRWRQRIGSGVALTP
jgi:hypothetical protein